MPTCFIYVVFLAFFIYFSPLNKTVCITERMTCDHCEQCAQLRPNSCSVYLYSISFEFKNVYSCTSTTLDSSGLPGTVYSHVNQTCAMLCIVSIVSGNLNYFICIFVLYLCCKSSDCSTVSHCNIVFSNVHISNKSKKKYIFHFNLFLIVKVKLKPLQKG